MSIYRSTLSAMLAAILVVFVAGPASAAADPGLNCEKAAAKALQGCVKLATKAMSKCFQSTGIECSESDKGIVKALAKAAKSIAKCADDAAAQSAGYGPAFTVAGLGERVNEFCLAEARSFGARTYGGPQGAQWSSFPSTVACLGNAAKVGAKHLSNAAKTNSKCVAKQRKSGNCDTTKTAAKISKSRAKSLGKITGKCTLQPLEDLIAVDAAEYLSRLEDQADCMVATTHPDVAPLNLDCGPRAGIPVPARETYVQVVLDQAQWGTKCGDGSDYAFWVRLPPAGTPVENVVVGMQGGGVCIFEGQCNSVSPGLFEAMSDTPETQGIMSNDPLVSPLSDFTKVYLPYCTQDVFIGGGTTSNWDSITVERFGGVNTRAALRYVRDMLWKEMDNTTAAGYSPEKLRVYFGGFSAGGFGTLYNYHYLLDDLQWRHTTAFPDSSLALDTGDPLASIASLGAIVLTDVAPEGWGNKSLLPPYCFDTTCPVGPNILQATAPRLKAVPSQQFMILSNQNDATQISTTFFPDVPSFVNELRTQYCATKDLAGVNYFLPSFSSPLHVISNSDASFTSFLVDGQLMTDWIGESLTSPETVADRASEGTITTDIPGTIAFPCSVGP